MIPKANIRIFNPVSLTNFQWRSFSQTAHYFQNVPSYNIAVVGAGPAGFYVAHHLLNKSSPKDQFKLHVDIFDRLPAPYGLSRYGVAPDHPEVKNCEEYLDNLMAKFSPSDEENHQVRFFGNVNIGEDINLVDLQKNYHSIVLSYGCTSADNQLKIPGNELPGVISARQFVNWYNGHPDCDSNHFAPPDLSKIEDVTIVGNGNVALDVARVLLADPDSHWNPTDICSRAVKALRNSSVKNVNIMARRGLLESAFSNKEVRELLELSKKNKVKFIPVDEKVMDEIQPFVKNLGRVDKRKIGILEKYSKQSSESAQLDPDTKTWSLQYLKSPIEFVKNPNDDNLLAATRVRLNTLKHDTLTNKTSIVSSEEAPIETVKNELVILSIGYQGSPLTGFDDVDVSFDTHQNRLLNHEGRILLNETGGENPHNFNYKKGWYTAGWIKKGPKGVIATTMMESFETADQILEDLTNDVHTSASSKTDVTELLQNTEYVSWNGWTKLSEQEIEIGEKLGKTREKVVNTSEMIQIANN